MRSLRIFALPIALLFFIFLLIVLLIMFIVVMIVGTAFRALGFSYLAAFGILLLVLLGSAVNIPVYTKKMKDPVKVSRPMSMMSFFYSGARNEYWITKTTIAVNFGGAVIPVFICAYLIYTHPELWMQFLIGGFIVTSVSYRFSKILPGVGISLPLFIPPVVAAVIALVLPGEPNTVIAFVSGVSGVLIGADLINLANLSELRSRTMSIGGAGTFDGIFLTGVVSVLLAALG